MTRVPTAALVKRFGVVTIAALALSLAVPQPGFAQRITGGLSGTVVDNTGAVIPGATVSVADDSCTDD